MPISSQTSPDQANVNIVITERFDYGLHQEFRAAYQKIEKAGAVFRIDLSQATYMDSSALGMVLLLKEHAEKCGGQVIICQPHSSVEKILRIANFDRFVKIEH
jgi:anti-anti-sigma factor